MVHNNETHCTRRLFDDDAYAESFTAAVIEADQCEHPGQLDILLDQTLFFPEEGGQSCDRGILGGFEVLHVRTEGNRIIHTIRIEKCMEETGGGLSLNGYPEPGMMLEGRIDMHHRFSNMQNHTGEHILSGIIASTYGFRNTGFHLSDGSVYLQFGGILDDCQLKELERKANEAVWKNLAVKASYPEPEELAELEYRSKIEIEGPVRIVEIEGIDRCACCAPHVKRTGEIGMIRILSAERMGNDMRLFILCGERALEETMRRQDDTAEVMKLTSRSAGDTAEGVRHLLQENQLLKEKAGMLTRKYISAVSASVPAEQRNVCLFEDLPDAQYRRELVNLLCGSRDGYCAVFSGNEDEGYSFIIGNSGRAAGGDARKISEALKSKLGAKGGGSPLMTQGSIRASKDDIVALFDEAVYT